MVKCGSLVIVVVVVVVNGENTVTEGEVVLLLR